MKRAFLTGLGLDTDIVDKIMAEHGLTVNSLNDTISTITRERDEATVSLKKFDGVDVEALKNAEKTLKEEYEGKLNGMRIDVALEKALAAAKVKHPDLLITKFDRSKIKADKEGNFTGIDEQVTGFKETYKDMFDVTVAGSDPANPEGSGGEGNLFNFGWVPKGE